MFPKRTNTDMMYSPCVFFRLFQNHHSFHFSLRIRKMSSSSDVNMNTDGDIDVSNLLLYLVQLYHPSIHAVYFYYPHYTKHKTISISLSYVHPTFGTISLIVPYYIFVPCNDILSLFLHLFPNV